MREVGLANSDDNEANGTLQPQAKDQNPVDTLRTRFSGNEPGAKSNPTAVCHAPNSSLIDEINLELIKGAPAPDRERNHLSPSPAIIKNRHKKIHLQRRKSVIDLSQDGGFDYGLPGEGFSQSNESELKIIAVEGNYFGYYSQGNESEEARHK